MEVGWHITGEYPSWYPRESRFSDRNRGRLIVSDYVKGVKGVIVPKLQEWWPNWDDKDYWQTRCNAQTGALEKVVYKKTRSEVDILTYSQPTMMHEGWSGHYVSFDEPPPQDKFIANKRGLIDYGGSILMTMTLLTEPWIIYDLYEKSRVDRNIEFFHGTMDDNSIENGGFLSQEEIEEFCKYLDEDELAVRRYGKFGARDGRIYKTYDDIVHVVDMDRGELDKILKESTIYFVLDPADSKEQAMAWFAVTPPCPKSLIILYREASYGSHVTVSQTSSYIKQCEIEDSVNVWMRIIDPNFGNKYSSQSGTTIRDDYAREGLYFIDGIDDINAGHAKVKELLYYDKTMPITSENCPGFYILSSCYLSRKSMMRYHWLSSKKGDYAVFSEAKPSNKWKDFCDLIRYLAMSRPTWRDTRQYESNRKIIPIIHGRRYNLTNYESA